MNEKINQQTVNVLQKINSNKLPLLILTVILAIIILVILISDYISFSKSEGFDVPDINSNNTEDYYNKYKDNLPDNNAGNNAVNNTGNNAVNNTGNNAGNNTGNNAEDYYNKYKDKIPDNANAEDAEDYYNKYKDKLPDNLNAKDAEDYYNKYKDKLPDNVNAEDYYNKYKSIKQVYQYGDSIKNLNVGNEFQKIGESIRSDLSRTTNDKLNIINKNLTLSKDNPIVNTFIILSFIFVILILCFIFLPSFKELSTLFSQISNVTYVIIYTIFLILFLRILPTDIMNSNAYYIVPITMIIAFLLFIISFRTNYITNFNINYERIKMIILYFCFITICITYYAINPGQYISKNFNISLLLVALISIFGFIYLIILLTLPNIYENFSNLSNSSTPSNLSNVLSKVSNFSKYGLLFFVSFFIIVIVLISTFPGGFFNNKKTSSIITPLLFIVCVFGVILFIPNLFLNNNLNSTSNGNDSFLNSKFTLVKKTLLVLFGLIISGILIGYIVYNIHNLTNKSNIPSFILSIVLIVSVLILVYKTIFVKIPSAQLNNKKTAFFDLLINIVFYIPCIFTGIFDTIMKSVVSEYNANSLSTYLILIIVIILIILYFIIVPQIQSSFNNQGGKLIVENEININSLTTLSNYQQLNDTDAFDYQYAISFWVFIESLPPNTNPNYNKFTSILNYGGKPDILYKADTNTLKITMDQEKSTEKGQNRFIEYDDNGKRIIYKNTNVLLQKWNNIIINYNGGTLDIFLNGELVKSTIEVIPYMKYDSLTIGNDDGINGGICNLVYFKKPLTLTNIYYIYNNLKNNNPPVVNYYNKTIIS